MYFWTEAKGSPRRNQEKGQLQTERDLTRNQTRYIHLGDRRTAGN